MKKIYNLVYSPNLDLTVFERKYVFEGKPDDAHLKNFEDIFCKQRWTRSYTYWNVGFVCVCGHTWAPTQPIGFSCPKCFKKINHDREELTHILGISCIKEYRANQAKIILRDKDLIKFQFTKSESLQEG